MSSPLPPFGMDGFDFNQFGFDSLNTLHSPHHLSPLPVSQLDNQSNNQSNNQSSDHLNVHALHSPVEKYFESHNGHIDLTLPHHESVEQTLNNQSFPQLTDQSVNLSFVQPVNTLPEHQHLNQSTDQSVNQPINQPHNQPTDQSDPPTNHAYNNNHTVYQRGAPVYLPQWKHGHATQVNSQMMNNQPFNQTNYHGMTQNYHSAYPGHGYPDHNQHLQPPSHYPVSQTMNLSSQSMYPVNGHEHHPVAQSLQSNNQTINQVNQSQNSTPVLTASVAPIDPAFKNNEKFASILLAPMEKRVARACTNCAASKVKCDNNRPCLRCRGVGKADSCFDSESRRRNRKLAQEAQITQSATMAIPMYTTPPINPQQSAGPVPAIVIMTKPRPSSTSPTHQPINEPVDSTINQQINQSINQTPSQPFNQSIDQPVSQPLGRSQTPAMDHSFVASTSPQFTSPLNQPIQPPYNQTYNQSNSQSSIQYNQPPPHSLISQPTMSHWNSNHPSVPPDGHHYAQHHPNNQPINIQSYNQPPHQYHSPSPYQSPPSRAQTPAQCHSAPLPVDASYHEHQETQQPVKRQRVDGSIESKCCEHHVPDHHPQSQPVQTLVAIDNQRQRQSIHHPKNQPINQSISMSSLLFQFRALLSHSLYGAFESIVQQFHAWNDELGHLRRSLQTNNPSVSQPNTQSTIQKILCARYWLRALIEQAVESPFTPVINQSINQYKPMSSFATSELYADQCYLATQCASIWPQFLNGPDLPNPSFYDRSRGDHSSLDDYLGHCVTEPTFLIGLATADAIRAPPLVSDSLAQLFDYPFAEFASMLRNPQSLLQFRQYPDIVPLIPAFLSAISARADSYGHASEWKTRNGTLIELVTRVRICYTTTGTPFALMGQCKIQSSQHVQQVTRYHPLSHPNPIMPSNFIGNPTF